MLFCADDLIDALLAARAQHYMEFKLIQGRLGQLFKYRIHPALTRAALNSMVSCQGNMTCLPGLAAASGLNIWAFLHVQLCMARQGPDSRPCITQRCFSDTVGPYQQAHFMAFPEEPGRRSAVYWAPEG